MPDVLEYFAQAERTVMAASVAVASSLPAVPGEALSAVVDQGRADVELRLFDVVQVDASAWFGFWVHADYPSQFSRFAVNFGMGSTPKLL